MTPDVETRRHQEAFRRFLANPDEGRVFTAPTGHPSSPTGFCPCDTPPLSKAWFYFRAWVLLTCLRLAWNGPKLRLLRWCGARIGQNVFISTDVWIDPAFPQLLTIEDNVMVGVGVKIALHEFGPRHFSAGRVTIRRGAVIGGFALLRHGIEIGPGAVVAGGAAVGRDVPPGKLAIGNPARVMPLEEALPTLTSPDGPVGTNAGGTGAPGRNA
jgi:acetyltransferase-like isoleucine patch superfamily enzyme